MSLIYGVNLSDRVYVASDTRVTHMKNGVSEYFDCICKNARLTQDVVVAAAGDTKLAGYLFNELKKEEFIKSGINSIKKNIREWAAKEIDLWLSRRHVYSRACLIIAGFDRGKKKIINGKRYIELVKEFQNNNKAPIQLAMKDVVFKGISAKLNTPNPNPELPVADSSVIALLSDAKNGILEVEEAEFGEELAYGPSGFTKEDIPKFLFGKLEFEEGNIFKDTSLLTAFITSTAQQKRLGSVGGSVVVNAVIEDGGVILPAAAIHRFNLATRKEEIVSKTDIINGELYAQTEAGILVKLINFYEYKKGKGNSEILL